jgi:tetratricopeptide (TPR) repeat protein
MLRIIVCIGILGLVGAGTWCLTGLDKTDGGDSKRDHHFTRALRCIVVVFLSAIFLGLVQTSSLGYGGIPILMVSPICIALVLRSSISELGARVFSGLLDPALHDHGQLDPGKSQRYQDTIGHLIHNGRREEAIKLCEELKRTGEVEVTILENTLEFLGVKQPRNGAGNPLLAAGHLRTQGDFAAAEQALQALLQKNPADEGAGIMLMRLYAEDLHQPERARTVLQALEGQHGVSASHLEFARRSIDEWSHAKPVGAEPPPIPPYARSVEDWLAEGRLGTAVELLEEQVRAKPGDVALQLRLAEVYAVNCKNFRRAEKLIRELEVAANADPQLAARARAKLDEWRILAGGRGAA